MIKLILLAASLLGASIASLAQPTCPEGHLIRVILITDCVPYPGNPQEVEFMLAESVVVDGSTIITKGGAKFFGRVGSFDGDAGIVFIGTNKILLPNGAEDRCLSVAIWPETGDTSVNMHVGESSVFDRVFFWKKDSIRLLKGTPAILKLQAPVVLPQATRTAIP